MKYIILTYFLCKLYIEVVVKIHGEDMKISKWYGVGGGLRIKPEPKTAVFEVVEGYKRLWTSVWFPYEALKLQYVLGEWLLKNVETWYKRVGEEVERLGKKIEECERDIEDLMSSDRHDRDYEIEVRTRYLKNCKKEFESKKKLFNTLERLKLEIMSLLTTIDEIAKLEGWSE